jgi:hypothetical protein
MGGCRRGGERGVAGRRLSQDKDVVGHVGAAGTLLFLLQHSRGYEGTLMLGKCGGHASLTQDRTGCGGALE